MAGLVPAIHVLASSIEAMSPVTAKRKVMVRWKV
jgi:hypothetical protein